MCWVWHADVFISQACLLAIKDLHVIIPYLGACYFSCTPIKFTQNSNFSSAGHYPSIFVPPVHRVLAQTKQTRAKERKYNVLCPERKVSCGVYWTWFPLVCTKNWRRIGKTVHGTMTRWTSVLFWDEIQAIRLLGKASWISKLHVKSHNFFWNICYCCCFIFLHWLILFFWACERFERQNNTLMCAKQ